MPRNQRPTDPRITALERQVAALRAENVALRSARDIAVRVGTWGRRPPAVEAPIAAAHSAHYYQSRERK
jgi:hypothetical protein